MPGVKVATRPVALTVVPVTRSQANPPPLLRRNELEAPVPITVDAPSVTVAVRPEANLMYSPPKLVVAAMLPGAMNVEGTEITGVVVPVATAIWFAVPDTEVTVPLPPDGTVKA
jgi:hypothetical protein